MPVNFKGDTFKVPLFQEVHGPLFETFWQRVYIIFQGHFSYAIKFIHVSL